MSALEAVLAHLHGLITTDEALFWIEQSREPACCWCDEAAREVLRGVDPACEAHAAQWAHTYGGVA